MNSKLTTRTGTSRLIFESVLIVLSVLLGLALSNWSERRADRKLAEAALSNFQREIEGNLAELTRVQPKHEQFLVRLGEAVGRSPNAGDSTAFDLFAAAMPEGGLDAPRLREAAWEAAVSTGALRLLDYDDAARLSETYFVQRSTIMPTIKLLSERFSDLPNFDPESRTIMLRVHQMMLNELTGQERYLMDIYRKSLESLPR